MVEPAPARNGGARLVRWAVIGLGLVIVGLELALSLVSWLPHVRLHLIGWAMGPLVLVAPWWATEILLGLRRGRDMLPSGQLPKHLDVIAVVAAALLAASFGAAIFLKSDRVYTCEAVYLGGRYGLDCHGDLRYTSAGQFYDVRAVHLRFVSGGTGFAAFQSVLTFAIRTRRRLDDRGDE